MIVIFYNFLIGLFYFGALIASPFNAKARKFMLGRNSVLKNLNKAFDKDDKIIWFHAASLGEFEQGRPVIEELKMRKPGYKILLTFFSPSGYEIRKNFKGADYVCYLPLDFSWHAQRFINIVKPKAAYFIKYEFWYNYINFLQQKNIPLFCISANFRPNQVFFKWYGFWYKRFLHKFNHLFVQNKISENLLKAVNVTNITVSGDTRFDRVFEIAAQIKKFPIIENFTCGQDVVIAGSTWPVDIDLLSRYICESTIKCKYIIAPHEVDETIIISLLKKLPNDTIRYSQATGCDFSKYRILVIDNIGILSSAYQYGRIAYIGGAFGKGLHNILEAATFGLPVVFGPKYDRFKEAIDLIEKQGSFSISDYDQLKISFDNLMTDDKLYQKSSNICKDYVAENRGATEIILKNLNFLDSASQGLTI